VLAAVCLFSHFIWQRKVKVCEDLFMAWKSNARAALIGVLTAIIQTKLNSSSYFWCRLGEDTWEHRQL
jgi:hypothetical protein